ncbi:MAG: cadherin repeat domain-containing protein [Candidatus Poribacteria bacterium]|nr:cadherin repeat domain-containing protein [Candidatus Poribacteria bacterium]
MFNRKNLFGQERTCSHAGSRLRITILVAILAVSCLHMQVPVFANGGISENSPIFTEGATTTRSIEENTPAGRNIGDPVRATDADGDALLYEICEDWDWKSFSIDSASGQIRTKAALDFETKNTYELFIFVSDSASGPSRNAEIIVTINVIDVDETLIPVSGEGERSTNNALTNPITDVTGRVRQQPQSISPAVEESLLDVENSDGTPPEATPPFVGPNPVPKRGIIQECPVGWQRSDRFAGRTRRVLLYEVNLEMDLQNRVSIYKPIAVAVYVHPDEALENLEGWKLQVALPYNHHRDYLLTAENAVVVDAKIEGVEGGFAFIANPEETPFPMTAIEFMGSPVPVPGFDYRLYDETGRRVDFGISCYKRRDIFQALKEMEDPKVLRKVELESFDWDSPYIRSEWTVPVPVNGFPGAPSLRRGSLVGKWAALKKQ